MYSALAHKKIILGITGGIAAYKTPEVVRRLREQGAEVQVVMTLAAKKFVTPTTLQAVSGRLVRDDLFDAQAEMAMGHIELARWADLILIAPASADFMAKLAHGLADELLTTLCLATTAKIVIAPAMNRQMWENAATAANVAILQNRGITIVGPGQGEQACGEIGFGRLLEPITLVENIIATFTFASSLSGKKILITAGPTREEIDPVRYLSNRSSGKMGHALATAAKEAGAEVTLVLGPTALAPIAGVKILPVISAQQMYDQVMQHIQQQDIFISAAAVADYRPQTVASQKIKKTQTPFTLLLTPNPDILASVGQLPAKPFIVGFAAETNNIMQNAQAKLLAKNPDVLVVNQVGENQGFEVDENEVILMTRNGKTYPLPKMSKWLLAREILRFIITEM